MLIGDPSLGFMAQEEPQGTWNVATAAYQNKSYYIGTQADVNAMNSLILSDDGLHMYVAHQSAGIVGQWNLGTAWDITTATYVGKKDFSSNDTELYGIAMSVDGTKLILLGNANDRLYEYTLSTPFNITTATYVTNYSVSAYGTYLYGMTVDRSGRYVPLSECNNDTVWRYSMSTPWSLASASSGGYLSVGAKITVPGKSTFSTDGNRLFVVNLNSNNLHQYNLTTPFYINDASYVGYLALATVCGTSVYQAHFDKTGKRMYVLGGSNKRVYQYALT